MIARGFCAVALIVNVTFACALSIQNVQKAYPEHIQAVTRTHVVWKDQSIMPLDERLPLPLPLQTKLKAQSVLENPTLREQISACYPLNRLKKAPQSDPGRRRYIPFFKKMYGRTQKEVTKHLRTITWMPKAFGQTYLLKVTTVNHVDQILESISTELDSLPHYYHPYLKNPGGTFNWRSIKGTQRLSPHSFGMSVDINVQYSNYWLWDSNKKGKMDYHNRIPQKIIDIFERHHFIWGGKWSHYDTMHFEYRPELFPLCKKRIDPIPQAPWPHS